MSYDRANQLMIPLILAAALAYLAGFLVPAAESLLRADAAVSGCGCGADCTCGCQCCERTDEATAAPTAPSCCSTPTTTDTAATGGPVWTGSCNCGDHGDQLCGIIYEPAMLAAATRPAAELPLRTLHRRAGLHPPARPRIPDDPVPRPRS